MIRGISPPSVSRERREQIRLDSTRLTYCRVEKTKSSRGLAWTEDMVRTKPVSGIRDMNLSFGKNEVKKGTIMRLGVTALARTYGPHMVEKAIRSTCRPQPPDGFLPAVSAPRQSLPDVPAHRKLHPSPISDFVPLLGKQIDSVQGCLVPALVFAFFKLCSLPLQAVKLCSLPLQSIDCVMYAKQDSTKRLTLYVLCGVHE